MQRVFTSALLIPHNIRLQVLFDATSSPLLTQQYSTEYLFYLFQLSLYKWQFNASIKNYSQIVASGLFLKTVCLTLRLWQQHSSVSYFYIYSSHTSMKHGEIQGIRKTKPRYVHDNNYLTLKNRTTPLLAEDWPWTGDDRFQNKSTDFFFKINIYRLKCP